MFFLFLITLNKIDNNVYTINFIIKEIENYPLIDNAKYDTIIVYVKAKIQI